MKLPNHGIFQERRKCVITHFLRWEGHFVGFGGEYREINPFIQLKNDQGTSWALVEGNIQNISVSCLAWLLWYYAIPEDDADTKCGGRWSPRKSCGL